jgi:hypothetical protein
VAKSASHPSENLKGRTWPTMADGPVFPGLADAKKSEFTDRKKFKGELFTALSRS